MSPELKPIWNDGMGFNYSFMEPIKQEKELKNTSRHVSGWGLARPLSLLPLALALGTLRWRTGRLWPCIALHGWSNLALVAYVLWPG